jgi:ferredoxin
MFNTGAFENETKKNSGMVIRLSGRAYGTDLPVNFIKESIMAYVISDDCTMCGACESACPVEAISAGDGKYSIDAGSCTDCGACEATCPMSAISAA